MYIKIVYTICTFTIYFNTPIVVYIIIDKPYMCLRKALTHTYRFHTSL